MILLVVIWVCSVGGLGARIWDLDFGGVFSVCNLFLIPHREAD